MVVAKGGLFRQRLEDRRKERDVEGAAWEIMQKDQERVGLDKISEDARPRTFCRYQIGGRG